MASITDRDGTHIEVDDMVIVGRGLLSYLGVVTEILPDGINVRRAESDKPSKYFSSSLITKWSQDDD